MLNARFLASNTVISLQHVLLLTKRYARDGRVIARLKKDKLLQFMRDCDNRNERAGLNAMAFTLGLR